MNFGDNIRVAEEKGLSNIDVIEEGDLLELFLNQNSQNKDHIKKC